jgi:glycosyltransferase involved in cell wall biosynthesis
MPVFKGADLIGKAITSLQQQTFGNFEAIISVDGNDEETAEACRPFLVDPRFRMVVHRERLDWVGNFNWLLQQDLKEFFCYRQHDDTTAPEFFEVLLKGADKDLQAAAIYCDCKYSGQSTGIEISRTINGQTIDRLYEFIERFPRAQGPALRGLIRSPAIRQAGLVRSDEFRAPVQVHGWLLKLLRWGGFRRIGLPLYYRLDRPKSFTRESTPGSAERKQAEWTTMVTGLLDAAIPACQTAEERRFFQETIFERTIAYPFFNSRLDLQIDPGSFGAACIERLAHEGNTHLLRNEEAFRIFHDLPKRVAELRSFQRSRLSEIIYRIRQRSRLGKLIYPKSTLLRISYQFRHMVELLDRQIGWVLNRRYVKSTIS